MKAKFLPCIALFVLCTSLGFAAEAGNWTGEYSDKKFLNGNAVFQLTIEQSGEKIQVSFDAANNDGSGCAPEAQGMATAASKDKLQFSFHDNQGNAGNGTLTRSGHQLVVSLKLTKIAKQDCAKFYREHIIVRPVK